MSKNSFRIESVRDSTSLEKSFEPALQKFKGKSLPPEEVRDFLKDSQEFDLLEKDYFWYVLARQEIEGLKNQGQPWRDIFDTAVNKQETRALEAFLDAIEAEQQLTVADADQLASITGIEDSQVLRSILTIGRESKYLRALRKAIEDGAMFSDLLQMEPSAFRLAEPWDGETGSKQKSIVWAIGEAYVISFLTYSKVSPHLRSVAQDLNAPYSIVVEAFESFQDRRRAS